MVANGERNFLRNVRLKHVRAPPTVVYANQLLGNIVQQARQDDFFRHAIFASEVGALQNMVGGVMKAQPEEIFKRWLFRHRLQSLHTLMAVAIVRKEKK